MTEAIIPMSLEYLDQCIDLYMQVFNAKPWNENWSNESTRAMLTDLYHTPKFKGFLFVSDYKVIGLIAGHSKTHGQGTIFCLDQFCVADQFQGKGYGSRLLSCLEEELMKEDINSISLLTSSGGMADKFYKKSGFEIKPKRIIFNKIL